MRQGYELLRIWFLKRRFFCKLSNFVEDYKFTKLPTSLEVLATQPVLLPHYAPPPYSTMLSYSEMLYEGDACVPLLPIRVGFMTSLETKRTQNQ